MMMYCPALSHAGHFFMRHVDLLFHLHGAEHDVQSTAKLHLAACCNHDGALAHFHPHILHTDSFLFSHHVAHWRQHCVPCVFLGFSAPKPLYVPRVAQHFSFATSVMLQGLQAAFQDCCDAFSCRILGNILN